MLAQPSRASAPWLSKLEPPDSQEVAKDLHATTVYSHSLDTEIKVPGQAELNFAC